MLGFYNYTVILTYLSLCSGVTGIWFAFKGHPGIAIMCLLASGLFDAFDGRIARTRKQSTDSEKKFGIQIDSLCDLVCFGVLPCSIGFASGMNKAYYVPVFCLYTLAALIRLAYFNVSEEERQQKTTEKRKNYSGLPVTSISLILPLFFIISKFIQNGHYNEFIILGVLIISGAMFIIEQIRIKKPGIKGILIMIFIGSVELLLLILTKHKII